jgi:hypothetical protein
VTKYDINQSWDDLYNLSELDREHVFYSAMSCISEMANDLTFNDCRWLDLNHLQQQVDFAQKLMQTKVGFK